VPDPVRLDWPEPVRRDRRLEGACLAPDSFGNVLTTIAARHLDEGQGVRRVEVGGRRARFVRTFGDGDPGELLALVGSGGRLEIAVREGRAWGGRGVRRGTRVVVLLT
jgi:S-adenosylmethionine hydrolase